MFRGSAGVFMPELVGVDAPEPGRLGCRLTSVDDRDAELCWPTWVLECVRWLRPKPLVRLVKGFIDMWNRPWRLRLAELPLCTYVLSLLNVPAWLREREFSPDTRVGLDARLLARLPCLLWGRLAGRLVGRLCAVDSGGVCSTGDRLGWACTMGTAGAPAPLGVSGWGCRLSSSSELTQCSCWTSGPGLAGSWLRAWAG